MLEKTRRLILFFAVVFYPVVVFASDVMTWDDCVSEVSKANPDILSAKSALSSSDYKAKAAYSGFFPQVSGEVDYNSGDLTQGWSNKTDSYSASVTAQQNVFSGFRDTALVKQGKANKDASASTLDNTKVKVSYDLKSAFASLLYAQNYSKLAENIIKRRDENSRLVELRFEGGMENRGSALLSKAFLGQARYEKQQADHSIEVARQQMAKVLGLDDFSDIKITGKIPIEEPEKNPDFLGTARNTPEYRQVAAKEKAARAAVTIAKANFSPQVGIFATASKGGNVWSSSSGSFGINSTTVGVNTSIPVFNGANNYFTLRSSESDFAAAKYNKQSTEMQILPKLKQTYTNFIDAYEKLKVDRAFVEAATVRSDIARGKYKNGLLTFEDWDIIENDLISKQKIVLQSERDLYIAEAAWTQAKGKGVIP